MSRKGRKKYLDGYIVRESSCGKKEVVYVGAWYGLNMSMRERVLCAVLPLSMAVVFLIGAFNAGAISRVMYAVLPFVLNAVPVALVCRYCLSAAMGKKKYTEREKDGVMEKLRAAMVASMVLSLISVAGTVIYAVRFADYSADTVSFAICGAYNMACAAGLTHMHKNFIFINLD